MGAGIQGRTQLMALCQARPIRRAYVYDLDSERSRVYAVEMAPQLGIEVIPDLRTALAASDVLSLATSARGPVFPAEWLHPGLHINGIGSIPMPAKWTARRCAVPCSWWTNAGCLAEAGDILIPIQEVTITEEHIYGELGQVIAGQVPGRTSDEQITLFKSVGLALQDVAAAARVYALALERGARTPLPL